mgnify:CR=1 FL=1
MTAFVPNRHFRRQYNRIFRNNPAAANMLLLLAELADEHGGVRFDGPDPSTEIAGLMAVRFPDPRAYYLPGGPQR